MLSLIYQKRKKMIIATHTNSQTEKITELHQVAAQAFEVKRLRPGFEKNSFVVAGAWYFDALPKAEAFYKNLAK